jgi:hypothetical protein
VLNLRLLKNIQIKIIDQLRPESFANQTNIRLKYFQKNCCLLTQNFLIFNLFNY